MGILNLDDREQRTLLRQGRLPVRRNTVEGGRSIASATGRYGGQAENRNKLNINIADFDYYLPKELIAQRPKEVRDGARLLVLKKKEEYIEEREFRDIVHYLRPGDVLVINNTRVIPARLIGKKETGGMVEVLLLKETDRVEKKWEALCRPAKRVKKNSVLFFDGKDLSAEICERDNSGKFLLKFTCQGDFYNALEKRGGTPLPPYIKKRNPEDKKRYQTVYAEENGSVAAPTAGLHFTNELLQEIQNNEIEVLRVTLHLGWASFRPIRNEEFNMQKEFYKVDEHVAYRINLAKSGNRRVIAVGSSTVRVLESLGTLYGKMESGSGWTDLFIYPPYRFKVVDGMITNFHLSRSTHLLMVSAFAGRENILKAYNEAIKRKFRFYSYGDSMLII